MEENAGVTAASLQMLPKMVRTRREAQNWSADISQSVFQFVSECNQHKEESHSKTNTEARRKIQKKGKSIKIKIINCDIYVQICIEFNIFALDKAKLHSCRQQRARLRGCLYRWPNLKSQAEIAPPRWWLSAVFVTPGPLLQLLSTLAQSSRFTYHMTHILHKMIFVSAACSSRRRYQTTMMIKWGKMCMKNTNCNSTMQHGCK